MPYACSYEVPAPVEMYREVRRLVGDEPGDGLIVHLVVRSEGGLRHLEVWRSESDWKQFHAERVEPALRQVLRAAGFVEMPPEPSVETLDLVDVQLGTNG